MSILTISVTIAFTLVQLERLAQRKNPAITTNTEGVDISEKFDTSSDDFMMAFATKSLKVETKHARWTAETRENPDGGPSTIRRRWELH